jgi:hypothetical protein
MTTSHENNEARTKKQNEQQKSKSAHDSAASSSESDRINSLLTKGFDLMETGLNLGFNLVSKAENIAQDKVTDWVHTTAKKYSQPAGKEKTAPKNTEKTEEKPDNQIAPVFNRLPLHSGGTARLSFSIENELTDREKKVTLSIGEVFAGDKSGFMIDGTTFSITPGKVAIEPLDFEKCVLSGPVPETAPPDNYIGSILVTDNEQYQIPVCLVVTESSPPSTEQ